MCRGVRWRRWVTAFTSPGGWGYISDEIYTRLELDVRRVGAPLSGLIKDAKRS